MKVHQVVFSVLVGIVAFGVLPSIASAQEIHAEAEPEPGIERSGVLFGLSLGGGTIAASCAGCDSLNGPAFDLHIGGMVSPRVGLMFDGYAVAHSEGDVTLTNTVTTAAFQVFGDRVWFKGGMGLGRLSISDGVSELSSDPSFAVLLAMGVEVAHIGNQAIDLQARMSNIWIADHTFTNVSVGLGWNWY